jgi:hypothetical protein
MKIISLGTSYLCLYLSIESPQVLPQGMTIRLITKMILYIITYLLLNEATSWIGFIPFLNHQTWSLSFSIWKTAL